MNLTFKFIVIVYISPNELKKRIMATNDGLSRHMRTKPTKQ